MAFYLAELLASTAGTVLDPMPPNAQIEALTIHVRQMIDFLWGSRSDRSSRDAYAAGWGVAHLTYRRTQVTAQEKQWDVIGIARGLAPTVRCFARQRRCREA